MLRRMTSLTAFTLCSLLCAGCASTADQETAATTTRTEPATSATAANGVKSGRVHHWVQSDQLQRVMQQLGSSSATQWPSTLPDDPEVAVNERDRNEAFRNGAELAASLAQAAARIPDSVTHLALSQADRDAFIATANTLKDQSQQLGRAARSHRVEDMQKLLEGTRATCISCHTCFKDISGDLPPRA